MSNGRVPRLASACSVSTPDNTHTVAALAAMQLGKHVYVQKPMTHDIYEARLLTDYAKKNKIVAQMGNQGASGDGVRQMREWYNAGIIGDAHTIYVWTNRPVWPQGFGKPKTTATVPSEVNWDLWLGPAAWQDYRDGYVPFNWRGYWDFGTGALGDMGCHLIDPAFKTVGLGYPSEVECSEAAMNKGNAAYYPILPPHRPTKVPGKNQNWMSRCWMDGVYNQTGGKIGA
jgi:predicted dehydrogenase